MFSRQIGRGESLAGRKLALGDVPPTVDGEGPAKDLGPLRAGGDGLSFRHLLEYAVEQAAQDHRYERSVVDVAVGRLTLVRLEDQRVDVGDAIDVLTSSRLVPLLRSPKMVSSPQGATDPARLPAASSSTRLRRRQTWTCTDFTQQHRQDGAQLDPTQRDHARLVTHLQWPEDQEPHGLNYALIEIASVRRTTMGGTAPSHRLLAAFEQPESGPTADCGPVRRHREAVVCQEHRQTRCVEVVGVGVVVGCSGRCSWWQR